MRATVRNLPRAKRPERRHGDGARAGRFRRLIFTMRPEEVMTLILFVPVAVGRGCIGWGVPFRHGVPLRHP